MVFVPRVCIAIVDDYFIPISDLQYSSLVAIDHDGKPRALVFLVGLDELAFESEVCLKRIGIRICRVDSAPVPRSGLSSRTESVP